MVDFELFLLIWGLSKHISYTDKIVVVELLHNNDVNSYLFTSEAITRRCSVRKMFLKFRQIYRKTLVPESLLYKVAGLAQVFSCEFCKIFKNTLFYRTPPVSVSVTSKAYLGPCQISMMEIFCNTR